MRNLNIPVNQGDILFGVYQKSTPGSNNLKYGINAVRVIEITMTFTQEIHIYLDNNTYVSLADLPNYFHQTYDEAKMICDQLNNNFPEANNQPQTEDRSENIAGLDELDNDTPNIDFPEMPAEMPTIEDASPSDATLEDVNIEEV